MKLSKIAAMAMVPLMFSGCYFTTIDSTQVGVKKNLGEVQQEVEQAGFAMSLIPFYDLIPMTVSNKVANFTGPQDAEDSSTELNAPGITVLTEQQLPVPLDVSVMYKLDPKMAPKMMAEFGPDGVWDNILIVKEARSGIRDAIGQVSLEKLNTQREQYESQIQAMMNSKLSKYGVSVTNVAIRNIGIPQSIQEAVLAKETAKQNAEKAKYQVEQAKAEAEVEIAKAEGVAKANNVLSGSLTDKLVQYKQLEIARVQADKWNGAMPTTVAGGNVPMMLMTK
jgi:regulator of protease activity HflC (stomatin/prohibitin superfamily)